MIIRPAYAKLNLTLEVLGRRDDGFHDISTVMQTISLADELRFAESATLSFSSADPAWDAEQSLVSRAARLIQETAETSRGALITAQKNIPLISGLGGDSSDAAATLLGLNELWGLELPDEKLAEMAAQFGSDVPFFLGRGTALAQRRGELITTLPPFPRHYAVIILPDVPREPGKTARLYGELTRNHFTGGSITAQLVGTLKKGAPFHEDMLFNTFENIVFDGNNKLKTCRDHLLKMGAPHAHLAGAGPALFALMKDKAQAEDLHTRCLHQQMEAYLAETVGG